MGSEDDDWMESPWPSLPFQLKKNMTLFFLSQKIHWDPAGNFSRDSTPEILTSPWKSPFAIGDASSNGYFFHCHVSFQGFELSHT